MRRRGDHVVRRAGLCLARGCGRRGLVLVVHVRRGCRGHLFGQAIAICNGYRAGHRALLVVGCAIGCDARLVCRLARGCGLLGDRGGCLARDSGRVGARCPTSCTERVCAVELWLWW